MASVNVDGQGCLAPPGMPNLQLPAITRVTAIHHPLPTTAAAAMPCWQVLGRTVQDDRSFRIEGVTRRYIYALISVPLVVVLSIKLSPPHRSGLERLVGVPENSLDVRTLQIPNSGLPCS